MTSPDHVELLVKKVESIVAKTLNLQAENDALRTKCAELTNALSAKTEQLASFEREQSGFLRSKIRYCKPQIIQFNKIPFNKFRVRKLSLPPSDKLYSRRLVMKSQHLRMMQTQSGKMNSRRIPSLKTVNSIYFRYNGNS